MALTPMKLTELRALADLLWPSLGTPVFVLACGDGDGYRFVFADPLYFDPENIAVHQCDANGHPTCYCCRFHPLSLSSSAVKETS